MAKNASSDLRVPRASVRPGGTNPVFTQIEALMGRVSKAEPKSGWNAKEWSAFLEKLTPGQRFVYAIEAFEQAINSGGFDSYFRYDGGGTASTAMEGLTAIGAPKFAAVLNKAVALFPKSKPAPDDEKREEHSTPSWIGTRKRLRPSSRSSSVHTTGKSRWAGVFFATLNRTPIISL